MKKMIAILILATSSLLFTDCAIPLKDYSYSFPKDIYTYSKLYDATLLYLNQKGEVVINTEKSVGLIHTDLENILLTQTNNEIIFTRSAKFSSYAEDPEVAWKQYNEDLINNISKNYFRINGQ